MKPQNLRWQMLFACVAIMLLASGCFQPGMESISATSVAQSGPTFTPEPSLTPQTIIITSTPFPTIESDISNQRAGLEADTSFTQTSSDFQEAAQDIDPIFITATFIVEQATVQAALDLTATAQSLGIGFPTATPSATVDPNLGIATAAPVLGADCVHEVSVSDRNLYRIALAYGADMMEIAQRSNISNINLIVVGQKLIIPGCGTTGLRPPPTSIPASGVVATTAPVTTGSTTTAGTPITPGTTYTVQQGDTLFLISLRSGIPVMSIANANGITNINVILINQQISIPTS
ncbi:MAG: LysM peptidoglycan-binding domain-containing protein [Anaerolineae bacterium]|nr:LysM peptidoglycan-binding domain-containing protein [Anaerolineae bacterium]